jgi:hypothetical protein
MRPAALSSRFASIPSIPSIQACHAASMRQGRALLEGARAAVVGGMDAFKAPARRQAARRHQAFKPFMPSSL